MSGPHAGHCASALPPAPHGPHGPHGDARAEQADRLFHLYLTDSLAPADSAALKTALQDPAFRQRWRELTLLEGALAERFPLRSIGPEDDASGRAESSGPPLNSARPAARGGWLARNAARWRWPLASAAALLLAVLALLFAAAPAAGSPVVGNVLFTIRHDPAMAGPLAEAAERAEAPLLALEQGHAIRAGDTLDVPPGGCVTLRLADGATVVDIAGGSRVSFGIAGKTLFLRVPHGRLRVAALDERSAGGVELETAFARLRFNDGQIDLDAGTDATRIQCRSGSARLGRLDTTGGKLLHSSDHARADASGIAISRPERPATRPATRTVFELNFSGGLPDYWNGGTWVAPDPASQHPGAVRCADTKPYVSPNRFAVSSHVEPRGFAPLRRDAVVRLTYRMERAGWFLLFFGAGQSKAYNGNLIHKQEGRAGGWQTVEVPLADFFLESSSPALDLDQARVVKIFAETTGAKDRGFEIARLTILVPETEPQR